MGKIIFNDVEYTGGGALPDGGDAGDILAKKSNDDGDAEWVKPPASIDAYTKAETDALLDEKAALTVSKISTAGGGQEIHATVAQGQDAVDLNYYKKSETPDYINLNINEDSFRFKTAAAVEAALADKADKAEIPDVSDLATKQEVTDGLALKADTATTYTKTEVDAAIAAVPTGVNFEVGVERWYGTYTDENGVSYQVYTKTVYIPALPATAGITQYPHGVANIKQILSIYGFTTDGFVLNAPRQVASDNISIYQASKSATNQTFSIEVGKDRSSKKAYVTMVYAKNN